jgi:hypothetical protein
MSSSEDDTSKCLCLRCSCVSQWRIEYVRIYMSQHEARLDREQDVIVACIQSYVDVREIGHLVEVVMIRKRSRFVIE